MNIPGNWPQALMIVLLAFIAIGVLALWWPHRKRKVLPDPWSGAIVKDKRYYITHWTAKAGREARK